MLSSELNSKKAIEVNIAIMRTYTMLRKILLLNKDVLFEIINIKQAIKNKGNNLELIFE